MPGDADHIMYVWLDALTNYLTAAGYPDTECGDYKTFWPASVHVVGKDILRFHAIYWPAFLMAAGIAPPKRIFAHGWWTVEGQKMSKTLRNVVEPFQLVDTYGLDQVRYFLLREVPFGNDGDFSSAALVNRVNSELANDFGNLAQRVLSMINRNCDAKVPAPGVLSGDDTDMLGQAHGLLAAVRAQMEVQALSDTLETIWAVVRAANAYTDHQAPWALRKTDPERMGTVLYVLAEVIRHLAILTQPFVPGAAARLLDQLAVVPDARDFAALDGALTPGAALPKPEGVFPRIVEDATEDKAEAS